MSKDKLNVTDSEMNKNSVNNYKIVFDDENNQDVKTKPKNQKDWPFPLPKRLALAPQVEGLLKLRLPHLMFMLILEKKTKGLSLLLGANWG